MKKNILAFAFAALVPVLSWASEGAHLDHAPVDIHDTASLQRGAKYFVNYCLSCHSANFMRFNRMAADLGISEDEVKASMIPTGVKVGDTMHVAMDPKKSKAWFGVTPPDLSVIARARGADYLYTYLRTFYKDPSRPWGVNNIALPNAAMPHVLWELQGVAEPVMETSENAEGDKVETITGVKVTQPGKLSPAEYDQLAADLVNFLVYMGEPSQLKRMQYGPWVLGFLILFTIMAYMLKKEYWKDVH